MKYFNSMYMYMLSFIKKINYFFFCDFIMDFLIKSLKNAYKFNIDPRIYIIRNIRLLLNTISRVFFFIKLLLILCILFIVLFIINYLLGFFIFNKVLIIFNFKKLNSIYSCFLYYYYYIDIDYIIVCVIFIVLFFLFFCFFIIMLFFLYFMYIIFCLFYIINKLLKEFELIILKHIFIVMKDFFRYYRDL